MINILGPMDDDLASALREQIGMPFIADWTVEQPNVLIRVQIPDGVLHVNVPRKRLYAGTIYIFVLWIVGMAMVLFGIAALFMRNQVRAIRRLASGGRGIRHGARYRADQAGGRHRGASGRDGLQSDAGARPPLPGAADRDAGRRLARSAHAADASAPGVGDDAARARNCDRTSQR